VRVPFWIQVIVPWAVCLLAFPVALRLLAAWFDWVMRL
jgi:hypothetical protein